MQSSTQTPIASVVRAGACAAALLASATGAAAVADEPDPYAMLDDSWITISGSVKAVQTDRFTLDYGDDVVTVEMDDGDRDADAYKLLEGDRVTVTGRIDDDVFESTKIEAGSVFVEDIGTTFFASSIDEETADAMMAAFSVPVIVSNTVVRGTVSDVSEGEFVIDAGPRQVRVEVDQLPYNPLDDEGYQKIEKGDRVRVTGQVDSTLFEGREFVADSVIELS